MDLHINVDFLGLCFEHMVHCFADLIRVGPVHLIDESDDAMHLALRYSLRYSIASTCGLDFHMSCPQISGYHIIDNSACDSPIPPLVGLLDA
jgi:hypothetical protein